MCEFPDCGRPHSGYGLCKWHRKQQRLGRPLTPIRGRGSNIADDAACAISTCTSRPRSNGLCTPHLGMWRRYFGRDTVALDLWLTQHPDCDVCGAVERLQVDHLHGHCPSGSACTVCRRGRLCRECNIGEGHLRGSAVIARKLADYLDRYERPN